jgi:DNA-binding CsgD family transcriptional regulator
MKKSELLDAKDARAIVRLLGEVCANPGDYIAKKHQLMDGLCQIIAADCWCWGLAIQMEAGKPSVHIGLIQGGFTEEKFAMFTQAYTHPDMTAIHEPFALELAEKRKHLTRLRQQLDPSAAYMKTAAYPYWQAADIDGIIMSLCPIDRTAFSIIGIYRSSSADLFTPRENRIAHILLSEVPDLHAKGWPSDFGVTLPDLSSRHRTALALLVHGYSRQKIAESMKLSLHTINDYFKVIFAHFSVHSQAELIVRFRSGDGGDA